jgi:predicted nucleic acid-binding Zn finger protein
MPTMEFIDGEFNRLRVYIKPALGGRFCTCPDSSKTVVGKDGVEITKYLTCAHLKAFSQITSTMNI